MTDRRGSRPDDAVSQLTMEAKPVALSKAQAQAKTKWNTENLALRLGADFASAASAATLVAPLISIIDRYVLPRHRSGRSARAPQTYVC